MENKTKNKVRTESKRKTSRKKTSLIGKSKKRNEMDKISAEKIIDDSRKIDIAEEDYKKDKSEEGIENECFAKWIAPEFIITKEERLIYKVLIFAAVLMIFWSIYQASYVVTIAFFLAIVVAVMHLLDNPRTFEYQINLDGIAIGDKLYEYDKIESFEVDDDFGKLKFKLKTAFFPVKEIYIDNYDVHYIRNVLNNFLIEEKQEAVFLNYKRKNNSAQEDISDEEMNSILKKLKKI